MERIAEGKIKLGYNLIEERFLKKLGARVEIVSVKDKEIYWIAPEGSELFYVGHALSGKEDRDHNGNERPFDFYLLKLSDGREFPLRLDKSIMSPHYAVAVKAFPDDLQK